MIVRMFQPRFADMVASGNKRQTVRPLPKRLPQFGDHISLRAWTGIPYRSKQRVLRESVITNVESFSLYPETVDEVWRVFIDRRPLTLQGISSFARADGFPHRWSMYDWFHANHKLPFHGIVIYWGKHCPV